MDQLQNDNGYNYNVLLFHYATMILMDDCLKKCKYMQG